MIYVRTNNIPACDLSKIKANESSSMEMQIQEDYSTEDSKDSKFEFRLTPQVWPCLYGKKVAFTNVLNRDRGAQILGRSHPYRNFLNERQFLCSKRTRHCQNRWVLG